MKKFAALTLFYFVSLAATAQTFSNDWINFVNTQPYSIQQYFKIKVWKDGIYRVSYQQLLAIQFPTTSNPHQFQIFHNGVEQMIYVAGEADNSFDSTDYIEFYGRKNDGWLDANLYENPNDQLNKNFSMYCDTAAYFLTVAFSPATLGKRMILENDTAFNLYNHESYFKTDAYLQFTAAYVVGTPYPENQSAAYDAPKGFTGGSWNGTTQTWTLNTPNVFASGLPAEVSTSVLNTNQDAQGHTYDFTVNADNTTVTQNSVIGYNKYDFNFNLNTNANIASGTFPFFISVNNPNSAVVRLNISYVNLRYPHSLSYNGESGGYKYLFARSQSLMQKARLDLTDFNNADASTRYVYMIEGDSVRRVTTVRTGNLMQALIPCNGAEKKCLLTMESATYTGAVDFSVEPVSTDLTHYARFTNYNSNPPQYDYLIVSHKKLWNEAQNYATYRNFGSHKALLADVDELYDQFAYGIRKHPLAIKNFCAFTLNKFTPKPKYLFLLGKAVYPYDVRLNATADAIDLVPSYGYPCSDFMFSNKIVDTTYYPALATGRLAAQNLNDVSNYLAKIQAMESQQSQPQDWMKQVLHFVGGDDVTEQATIRYFMDSCASIIQDTSFGGHVTSYYKISTDPIQYLQGVELQNKIDSGVALMTFFGHAAGSTFDIATNLPQVWQNHNKYPLISAYSCNVGDIFSENRLLNEDFVLLPNQGAIGMIAKPTVGSISDLGPYGIHEYKSISYYNYGETIGSFAQHATDSLLRDYYSTGALLYKSTAFGQTLHGDPGFALLTEPKPDLMVNQSSVYFKPDTITTDLATFDVNIIISNLGKAFRDSFQVELRRKFPDNGPNKVVDTLIAHVNYKDTLKITLPVDVLRGAGLNYFDVFVDYTNVIDETPHENNNSTLNVPLLIQSPDISPIYPYKYAIVPNNTVTLKAFANTINASSKTYKFEVDTTDAFNTPFLRTTTVTQNGGLVKWTLPFSLGDSTVYFWRVALDPSLYPTTYHWKESSFQYINHITGWEQAHFFQFKDDTYNNIVYNKPSRLFEFSNTQARLQVTNLISPTQIVQKPEFFLNGALLGDIICNINILEIAVFDSISLQPWTTADYDFGEINGPNYTLGGVFTNCTANPNQKIFQFFANGATHPEQLDSVLSMIKKVPKNDYLLMFNVTSLNPSDTTMHTWPQALKDTLHNLGFTSIDTIQNYRPWIFFCKKGYSNAAQQVLGTNATPQNPFIHLDTLIGGNWYKGYITSEIIGPAMHWTSLHWDSHSIETPTTRDSIATDVIGIDSTGKQTVLIPGIQPSTKDLTLNINANQYPYLYLRAYVEDDSLRTPRQLNRWQIYYDEVPECLVDPNGSTFYSANMQQGDSINWNIQVENVSNTNMTPLLVDFYLFDKNNVRHNINSPRYGPLVAGQSIMANTHFGTLPYDGLNSLWIEANPRNDQREQFHFNNFGVVKFKVNKDITNPILDVTFDNIHILNGDIVSAKPKIAIKLKDENKFLALDTTNYKIYITDPSGNTKQVFFEPINDISTGNTKMKWTPPALPDNTFKIEFSPIFTQDGIYELRAQSRDKSLNLSGANDYRISFEVITHSSITNVMNYPNPFTTSTRFVFTLTGSDIPTYFKVQIMTVTGKIIREITLNELGNMHIGRNITEYAWDGKDEFGDRLAQGLYLYRVKTSINDQAIEHRDTDADKYFTKGWGKMYLLK